MKRIIILLATALSLITANAQIVKEVMDSVKSGTKTGNVKTMVSSVKGALSNKAVNAEKIVGTWQYVKPVVLSTSGRILSKLAANSIDDKLEDQLNKYCERAHVSAGNTYFEIRENGTYTYSFVDKKTSGTWMADGDKMRFAVKNVQAVEMVSRMEHNDTLALVMDTSVLIKEIQEQGGLSDSKANNGLIKLSKQVKKMKSGFLLVRKHRK